ncbi:MAG TPA: DUF1653 domain-containing protein [Candidatus Paceibacterota bacterium]|nr:DUF1653 domain-containing protein [Candidatus Paceibacterota bacterium]
MPKVGATYQHYKGAHYKVLFIAQHSDTEEKLVIYQDVDHPEKVWARSPEVFMGETEWEGKKVARFTLVA